MENAAVFTIMKGDKVFSIKSKKYNTYNKYDVPEKQLFEAMAELTDTFNNVIGVAILFEVG